MATRLAPVRSSAGAATVPGMRVEDFMNFETDFLTAGVVEEVGDELAVVENSGGANMSVQVGIGRALVEFTTTLLNPNNTTKAWITNEAVLTLTVPTADSTHPRIDRIVAYRDTDADPNGASSNIGIIELIQGTPAGSPSAPSEPTGAVTLALVSVPASDTTITNGQITDQRPWCELNEDVLRNVTRQGLLNCVAAASGTNTITATFDRPITSLVDKTTVIIIPANDNTGAVTFSPNGLSAKAIRKLGNTALAAGDLKARFPAVLTYNASDDNWKLQNLAASQASLTPLVLTTKNGSPSALFACAAAASFKQQATIAFDAVSTYTAPGSQSTHTIPHTCTGNNRYLEVGFYCNNATDNVTGVTYAGQAMTRIGSVAAGTNRIFKYAIANPASGPNNIVISLNTNRSVEAVNTSYTGVNQDFFPDASNTNTSTSATSISTNTTTANDLCWVSAFVINDSAAFGGYTGTARGPSSSFNMIDNNAAKTPPGAVTLGGTWSGAGNGGIVASSFAPAQTGPELYVFDFDQSTRENAEFVSVLPSAYTGGAITAKFHWVSSSGTGDVVWGIEARALADQDDSASLFGTAQKVTDTKVSSKLHITSATSSITIAGTPVAGQLVAFRVFRDAGSASDTFNADARLVAVEITF